MDRTRSSHSFSGTRGLALGTWRTSPRVPFAPPCPSCIDCFAARMDGHFEAFYPFQQRPRSCCLLRFVGAQGRRLVRLTAGGHRALGDPTFADFELQGRKAAGVQMVITRAGAIAPLHVELSLIRL